MKKLRRSMLFMPGNNPGMLQSAPILGADSVILDLEDAVSIEEKDSARNLVCEAIKTIDYSNVELVVRINPLDTEFGHLDLKSIAKVKPDTILVPKADEAEIKLASSMLAKIEAEEGFENGTIKLIPLIETAYGLETVFSVVNASKRVCAVLLGAEDLTSDFGIKRTKLGEEIFYARSRVSAAARAARIDSIDTPFTDTDDTSGLEKDTAKAKSLGLTGKAAINPRQIDTIHMVLAPSIDEIKHAKNVLSSRDEAQKEGKGVFSLNGKMVDAPVIARAEKIVELASLLGM